jgi:hypothetical protein
VAQQAFLEQLPAPNPILEDVLLGSMAPRLALPLPLKQLPDFTQLHSHLEAIGPRCRAPPLASTPTTLDERYRALTPLYDKYADTGLETGPYNYVNLDLEKARTELEVIDREVVHPGHPTFESRFESGNLAKAYCLDGHYHLILQNDINSLSFTQWFFFSVDTHLYPHERATFKIVNLYKRASLYRQGMKIMALSTLRSKLGWRRVGENIRYYENDMVRRPGVFWNTLEW